MSRRRSSISSFMKLAVAVAAAAAACLFATAAGHGGDDDAGDSSSSSSSSSELHSKGLIAVKLWCLAILLVSTFAGGVSPYFLRWNESFLVLGTQFAAGVFLGTSLMHFLSDSTSSFGDLTEKEYPFSFMLAASGYLLTMLADLVILSVTARVAAAKRVGVTELAAGGEAAEEEGEEGTAASGGGEAVPVSVLVTTATVGDAVLLIFALCFHSVFEGIAIGVAGSKGDAWKNLWTICLHKVFAAISLGVALLRMLPTRPLLMTAAYSLAFAVSSPVGVGIGIAIDATTEGATADWIYAISMGLATGVFVYVAINHLIAKGYRPARPCPVDTPVFKYLAVVVGVAIIAVVMIWDT